MSAKFLFILGLILMLFCVVACSSNEKVYIFKDNGNMAQNDLSCYNLCLNRENTEVNYTCHTVPVNCANQNCTCVTD